MVAEGLADAAIERELARRRSFRRTAEAARDLKEGTHEFDFTRVEVALGEFGWSNERELKSYQVDGVAHALTAINFANFSVPGSGKTITTLATAIAHLQSRTVDLLVTVGPLSSFEPWEQEARAAIGNGLRVRRVGLGGSAAMLPVDARIMRRQSAAMSSSSVMPLRPLIKGCCSTSADASP